MAQFKNITKPSYRLNSEILNEDRIYIHTNPQNFINTYQSLEIDAHINAMAVDAKKELNDKIWEFEIKCSNIANKIMWENGSLEFFWKRIQQIVSSMDDIFVPTSPFQVAGKKGMSKKNLEQFTRAWNKAATNFINLAKDALKKTSKVTIDNKEMYKTKLTNLEARVKKYKQLVRDKQFKEAYYLMTNKDEEGKSKWWFSADSQDFGWLLEPIQAYIIEDAIQELADSSDILFGWKVGVTGAKMQLADYKIELQGEEIGVNLKFNDTSYTINRAFKLENNRLWKEFFYSYYNYFVFKNMNKKAKTDEINIDKIRRKMIVSFYYEWLWKVLLGEEWEKPPVFVVFRNNFIPTLNLIKEFVDKWDKIINNGTLVSDFNSSPKQSFNTKDIWDKKSEYLTKARTSWIDINYFDIYKYIEELLPIYDFDESITFTYYINKGKIKNAK